MFNFKYLWIWMIKISFSFCIFLIESNNRSLRSIDRPIARDIWLFFVNNYDDIMVYKAIRLIDNVKRDEEEKTEMWRPSW